MNSPYDPIEHKGYPSRGQAPEIYATRLKITKVTNCYIEFELKDIVKKLTKLRVNQSLITVGHRVIDGDARQKPKAIQL